PLRQRLADASPNLLETASVLLPETTGVEFLDVIGAASAETTSAIPSSTTSLQRRGLFRALIRTLPMRDAASVTRRTVDLFNQAIKEFGLDNLALDAVISVTTQPSHPLNADRLHTILVKMSRPERDAFWGAHIYDALSQPGPLHRLLRWAEQLPTPARVRPDKPQPDPGRPRRAGTRLSVPLDRQQEPTAEVVRLAATTLAWTLASSNRFLRDRATKALVQLLLGFPDILSNVLARFLREHSERVDDPYVFERLTIVAYGVVLRAGPAYPDKVGVLARQLVGDAYGDPASCADASHNALLCDAARGVLHTALRMGVIAEHEATGAQHPHAARRPSAAPTRDDLEARFPSTPNVGNSWSIFAVALGRHSDFAKDVAHTIGRISRLPLSHPRPLPRNERRQRPDQLVATRIAAFRASLPESVQQTLGSADGVARLLERDWIAKRGLDDRQHKLLLACRKPPPADEQLIDSRQDGDWGSRWILARVASLGWTPERFGEFDLAHGHNGLDRNSHRAEHIGKKYQRLALLELGERLANHYHLGPDYDDEADPVGAWHFMQRDLDPSLPPAPHPLSDDDDDPPADSDPRRATFPPAPPGFWAPPIPLLPDVTQVGAWMDKDGPFPDVSEIGVRTDGDGVRWVVLDEYVNDTPDGRGFSGQRDQAEQWHHINAWLIQQQQLPAVLNFVRTRSLVPRWMPGGREPHGIYLGEYPAAPAALDDSRNTSSTEQEVRYIDHDSAERYRPTTTKIGPSRSVTQLLRSDSSHQQKQEALATWWFGNPSPEPILVNGDRGEPSNDKASHVLDDLFDELLLTDMDVEEDHAAAPEPAYLQLERDIDGTVLRAMPAAQYYSWSASDADCSIDAPVSGPIPANILIKDGALTRHPDRLDWYTDDGTLAVTSRWCRRDTGEATTLLIREDWLDDRLHKLGYAIVQGIFGERQRVTTDPRQWTTFSQVAGYAPRASWLHSEHVHKHRRRNW
ncbi:MAG: hypothetical protein QOE61_1121, partial [Micromonosporaceae bacterium]|nr:hypothetical protein [Micromonosporaceae bacterium]